MKTPSNERFLRLIKEMEKEAYQKGWNDAVANIVAAARKGVPIPDHLPPTPARPTESRRGGTIIDTVVNIVHEQPGLRGAEIIRLVVERMGIDKKVADRTTRTSLMRLRKRGRVMQRSKKWYPKETEENG